MPCSWGMPPNALENKLRAKFPSIFTTLKTSQKKVQHFFYQFDIHGWMSLAIFNNHFLFVKDLVWPSIWNNHVVTLEVKDQKNRPLELLIKNTSLLSERVSWWNRKQPRRIRKPTERPTGHKSASIHDTAGYQSWKQMLQTIPLGPHRGSLAPRMRP